MKIPDHYKESVDNINNYFTEAVFTGGKETVAPLLESITKIKEELDSKINEQDDSVTAAKNTKGVKVKPFDPKAFWKNTLFKDFEDQIRDIFGFRNVSINPYIEKYNSTTKKFESCELNCTIYHSDRFPIEGLVTDKGFYDNTHSVNMEIWMSLGLLQKLTSEEVLAVLLHEFGHSIDPALVDIKYTETNILSKYITDRKGAINKSEERAMKKMNKLSELGVFLGSYLIMILLMIGIALAEPISMLFQTKEGMMKRNLKKIKEQLENDKDRFNRQNYSEAFADNFARMYGYGSHLAKGLNKLTSDMDRELRSRFKKEKYRQQIIYKITMSAIKDVHKTDIHRIRNLIQEYKKDINDPNTPPVVKKQLEEDLLELEKVLDQYLNHKDEFQKRVNNLINEELKKLEESDEKNKEPSKESDSKESEKK
jgi:hypothetical protein